MILLAALLLALLWGLARGGTLARVPSFPLQAAWIALAAFGLQIYSLYFPVPRAEGILSLHGILFVLSYALLFRFVWINRTLPGMWLLGAGLVANFLVMLTNGGYMPITREALAAVGHLQNALGTEAGSTVLSTKDIILPREATQLWFLSDIFMVPPPFPIPSVFSIGDVLVASGVFVLVQRALGRGSFGSIRLEEQVLAKNPTAE